MIRDTLLTPSGSAAGSYTHSLPMKPAIRNGRRNLKGNSDSFGAVPGTENNYCCSECTSNYQGGSSVLLFYEYLPNNSLYSGKALAKELTELLKDKSLRGKIRVGKEGYNITVAGSNAEIDTLIKFFMERSESLLPGVQLLLDRGDNENINTFKKLFFKPTSGCFHIFDSLSIKYMESGLFEGISVDHNKEIRCTSLELITSLLNLKEAEENGAKQATKVISLQPKDFHEKLLEFKSSDPFFQSHRILDTRNHYESKIGHFQGALLPPLRKYSSFPKFLEEEKVQRQLRGKTIFSYCTGGVRCETAAPLILQSLQKNEIDNGRRETVYMLNGGIHNYLQYCKEEGLESLFIGGNYVFDGRQSLGGKEGGTLPSSARCKVCGIPTLHFTKCFCHVIVIACLECCKKEEDEDHVENGGGDDPLSVIQTSSREGVVASQRLLKRIFCCDSCKLGEKPCRCEQDRRELLYRGLMMGEELNPVSKESEV